MNKGFVIMAQNTDTVNYVQCAEALSKSIRQVMPDASVTIITSEMLPLKLSGFANDWQVYEASPYEYTIKLEADMIIPTDISYWWDVLQYRDLVLCTTIRNFKGSVSDVMAYRKFITDNQLPNIYNAITYFKKSDTAKLFFSLVREIFENWAAYREILKCDINEPASTDWVYAIASHLMGVEQTTLPTFTQMSMVHMKQHINGLLTEDWTKELITEYNDNTLKINTIVQRHPFHYYVKSFSEVVG
jgi:hypothetical protein